jgi:hypothetical protein
MNIEFLAGNPTERGILGILGRKWWGDMKMDLRETVCELKGLMEIIFSCGLYCIVFISNSNRSVYS